MHYTARWLKNEEQNEIAMHVLVIHVTIYTVLSICLLVHYSLIVILYVREDEIR